MFGSSTNLDSTVEYVRKYGILQIRATGYGIHVLIISSLNAYLVLLCSEIINHVCTFKAKRWGFWHFKGGIFQVQCDKCKIWIHAECDKISNKRLKVQIFYFLVET